MSEKKEKKKTAFQRSDELEQRFVKYYKKYPGNSLMVLLGFYKGQYHKFLISSFFFLIKHSPALFSSLLIANVINGVLAGGEMARYAIMVNVGIWLLLLSVHLPANYLYSKYRSRVTRGTEAGLRGALVRKLQELSIPYHTQAQSGRLQSKVIRDVEAIETLSSQLFINVMNIVMNLTIMIFVTAVKNRIILLFFVMVAPVASLTIVAFRKKIGRENRAFRVEMENTSARVMEMVEMVPVTRAHALEEVEKDRMARQLEETAEKGYRLDMVQANFGAVGWVVFQIFQALCLAFSGYLALKGKILVGDITFYQTSFTTVVNQFTALINLLPVMTKGLESVTSVGEVLSCDDVEHNDGKEELKGLKGEYEFCGVGYSYPDAEGVVLKGLNMKVKQGETIAIVGESGSGKTTMLNLLVGFMMPKEGSIRIDGKDITGINLKTYRRFLSVVPQMPLLFTGTLRDNITYGMENVTEEQIMAAVRAANLSGLVEKLPEGIDSMIEEHGANLSGGQRQRIAIARAVIRDPRVIILDEATSALDVISEKEIQDALQKLEKGRTTFIVAHRLSTVKNADRIAVLSGGQIVEEGSYSELMEKKGVFYHMESLQVSLA
ncbi:MAG: ABC transporter ATP-binding protein [Lachnospiraceae bacterium]|nr:ABC transporter ATP-binding protein [Lachnospiraceae bacterium]